MNDINETKRVFMKYYDLWEVNAIKWKAKRESWLNSPLDVLDTFEMEDTISTCLNQLSRLNKLFTINVNIKELIEMLLKEIHQFNCYYEVIIQLRHESFKDKHFNMLINEIYSSRANKPEIQSFTIDQLINDKIFEYTKEITKIANAAKIEYNIYLVIDNLQKRLQHRVIRCFQLQIGTMKQYNFIRNLEDIIFELS